MDRRVLRPLLVLVLVASSIGCRDDTEPRPRHLLLVSLDTTRADHVECGGGGARTPRLNALAASGVCFTDASTVVTTTLASHVSLFTGRAPQSHGVPENGFRVAAPNRTLAEILSDEGWSTGAVLGSFALSRAVGADQGFDHFDEDFDLLLAPGERVQNERRADRVTDGALAWTDRALEESPDRGLFLFAHYFDAHAPYEPRGSRNGGDPADGEEGGGLAEVGAAVRRHQVAALGRDLGGGQVDYHGLTREMLERAPGVPLPGDRALARRYAEEVGAVDSEVGRLLDGWADRGLLEEALVVVVGDHGETFWEHGDVWNHGLGVYQTTVRVPLIFRPPGFRDGREGLRVTRPVSTLDVLPTVLDLLGVSRPEVSEGRSLVPMLSGLALENVPIFVEATHPAGDAFHRPGEVWRNVRKAQAVRDGRWKLIVTPYLGMVELYDLEADPGEATNLLGGTAEPSPEVAAVARRLQALLEDWRRGANPLPTVSSKAQSEEVRARLRSLGYL